MNRDRSSQIDALFRRSLGGYGVEMVSQVYGEEMVSQVYHVEMVLPVYDVEMV